MSRVVVVGAGIAGVRVAQALRRHGFDGGLTLVGDEEPHDRPPLSKGFLAGAVPAESLHLLKDDVPGLEVRTGRGAVRLDPAARRVILDDGGELDYDTLVIATGARARPSPWQPESGVHVLRSLAHARALRADLARGGPVVVVGAGFIGGEVASTCRTLGHPVTLVDPVPVPMARLMGEELGRLVIELHESRGVHTRFGVGVESITGTRGDLTVTLTDGTALACAVAVVGIGAEPNDGWLRDSGLLVDDGVVCDDHGRTSDPAVYAIGDVARWGGRRHEHWTNSVEQASAVARAITGQPAQPRAAAFVWSDQHDAKITILGEPTPLATVVHGETGAALALFEAADGALAGGATLNWPRASIVLRKALRAEATTRQVLSDLAVAGPARVL